MAQIFLAAAFVTVYCARMVGSFPDSLRFHYLQLPTIHSSQFLRAKSCCWSSDRSGTNAKIVGTAQSHMIDLASLSSPGPDHRRDEDSLRLLASCMLAIAPRLVHTTCMWIVIARSSMWFSSCSDNVHQSLIVRQNPGCPPEAVDIVPRAVQRLESSSRLSPQCPAILQDIEMSDRRYVYSGLTY